MKKIILSFIALLVFIPICINATVYANFKVSQENTTKYIKNFKSYQWFIDPTTKYLYEGNTLKTLSGFSKGGFVNQFEYNASLLSGKSYLSNVMKYWTMTSNGSSSYSVVGNNITTSSEATKELGSRITEYIRKKTKVIGSGTYTDPWEFVDPDFETKLTFSNPQITGSSGVTGEKTAGYGDTITYVVELTNNGLEAAKITLNEIKLQESIGTKVKKTSEAELSTTLNGIVSGETKPNAVIAMNALLSENGYTFVLEPGQTITLKYNVVVIGNAGDKVVNQVVYTVDGLQPKANDEVVVNIEKLLDYNEVRDIGANIVLVIDDSGSMKSTDGTSEKTNITVYGTCIKSAYGWHSGEYYCRKNNSFYDTESECKSSCYTTEYRRPTKMEALRIAAGSFVNTLLISEERNENNKMCIVYMNAGDYISQNKNEDICMDSSHDAQDLYDDVTTADVYGGTPYYDTLYTAKGKITSMYNNTPTNDNFIVFLSDGEPNDGTSRIYSMSDEIKSYLETKIYTIGFSVTYSARQILTKMSSNNTASLTQYYYDASTTDINEVFSKIATSIGSESGQTKNGVKEISHCIDPNKKIFYYITPNNGTGTQYKEEYTFIDALNSGYMYYNKVKNIYEINFAKFKPDDKIAVSYFMLKGCKDD